MLLTQTVLPNLTLNLEDYASMTVIHWVYEKHAKTHSAVIHKSSQTIIHHKILHFINWITPLITKQFPKAAILPHSNPRSFRHYSRAPKQQVSIVIRSIVTGGGVGLLFDFVRIVVVGRVFHFTAVHDQLRSRSKAHRLRLLWCRLDSLVTNIRCRR